MAAEAQRDTFLSPDLRHAAPSSPNHGLPDFILGSLGLRSGSRISPECQGDKFPGDARPTSPVPRRPRRLSCALGDPSGDPPRYRGGVWEGAWPRRYAQGRRRSRRSGSGVGRRIKKKENIYPHPTSYSLFHSKKLTPLLTGALPKELDE